MLCHGDVYGVDHAAIDYADAGLCCCEDFAGVCDLLGGRCGYRVRGLHLEWVQADLAPVAEVAGLFGVGAEQFGVATATTAWSIGGKSARCAARRTWLRVYSTSVPLFVRRPTFASSSGRPPGTNSMLRTRMGLTVMPRRSGASGRFAGRGRPGRRAG